MPSYEEKRMLKKTCANMLNLMLLLRIVKKKKKKTRRWWVKPHLKNEIRSQFGAYHTVFTYFKLCNHEEFIEFMRMNTDAFSTLYDLMERRLRKHRTNLREPLYPELKLAFVIWFLAHGGNVKQAALMFHIGTSTAYQLLRDVCVNLVYVLNPLYVPKPTAAKWTEIANLYEQLWNFPNCIGALDGKHIDIEQPASAGSFFWSYKKKHTFILMAIADAKKRFVWYSIGDFGSLNDASVFSDTDFTSQLANDELDIPSSRSLPNTDIEMPFVLIADEIFALSKHLVKSFSKSIELTVEERVFNYRLKKARLCIECAFGMIVKKYQILQQKLKFDLITSHFIVAAIICLHNFLITTNAENNMDDVNEEVVEGNNHNEENQNLRMTPVQQRQPISLQMLAQLIGN